MERLVGVFLFSVFAIQATDAFRITTAPLADVHQETLQATNPAAEVFPGTYQSSLGAAVMTRLETLMGRVDDADRNALMAARARAGFDRSIIKWAANPSATRVVIAVRYYREPLFRLELEMTDDYGRADPVDPARYEFFAIAVCARADAAWSCTEEQLAEVAGRHQLPLPQTRPDRVATAEKLVELVLQK